MKQTAFVHDHPQFDHLLAIVSDQRGVTGALVEKDYWVTHVLWALQQQGLRILFKGGTSLSKGYDLIRRFSEDLDVRLEADDLVQPNWSSQGAKARTQREAFFAELRRRICVPGATVEELVELRDEHIRNAVFAVRYKSPLLVQLPDNMRPFVQIEAGSARVTPGEPRPITSWIHQHLAAMSEPIASLADNRPRPVHCVDPIVTLLEKIEAIGKRFGRTDPASFVRHYDDAARILDTRPPMEKVQPLLDEMREAGDIRRWPSANSAAFNPAMDEATWTALEQAATALRPMFWDAQIPLTHCALRIRKLLQQTRWQA